MLSILTGVLLLAGICFLLWKVSIVRSMNSYFSVTIHNTHQLQSKPPDLLTEHIFKSRIDKEQHSSIIRAENPVSRATGGTRA